MRTLSSRLRRYVPPFWLAYGLSLSVLVLMVVWIFVDRWFHSTLGVVLQDLRLEFLNDTLLRELHQWEFLGPRLFGFAALSLLALASTVIVFARTILGSGKERSIRAMLLATALLALWLSLFVSYDRLWAFAFQYRIVRQEVALRNAAAVLSQQWPKQRVALAGLGDYEISHLGPNALCIVDEDPLIDGITTFHQPFYSIRKSEEGDISFMVESNPECWVHKMGEGRSPQSFTRGDDFLICRFELRRVVDLGDGLYLAYYDMLFSDPPSSADQSEQPVGTASAE